jgi:hypothetical protein
MADTIVFGPIFLEDLQVGNGTVADITLPDNSQQTLTKIGIQSFLGTAYVNASDFTGSDIGAKINTAVAALPAAGGVIDCRGLTGAQSAAATITLSKQIALLLPMGSIQLLANPGILITSGGCQILGQGQNATVLQYSPSTTASAIKCQALTAVAIAQIKLSGFTMDATGNSQVKTAFQIIDSEEMEVSNIAISNWSDGTKSSVGLEINGRQAFIGDRLTFNCDLPCHIKTDPNTSVVAADHFHFSNIYFIADASQPCWLVDSGVWLTNCTWDGYQAWVGGSHGIQWTGYNGSTPAYNIAFHNVRAEQGAGAGGGNYVFHLNPTQQMFSVLISNCTSDSTRNFIFMRTARNYLLEINFYDGLGVALNLDSSCSGDEEANFWNINAGASLSVVGALRTAMGFDETGVGYSKPVLDLVDGTGNIAQYRINGGQIGATTSAHGSGTAYTITTTPAAVAFGTTSPSIVLSKIGTYLLFSRVVVEYVGATFAGHQTVTVKLRRTNNTASDLTNGTTFLALDIVTTKTADAMVIELPTVPYGTLNTTDAITLFASVDVGPSAGSIVIREAEILALRIS